MLTLRPHQVECSDLTYAALKEHEKVGMICPTSFGKTETFIDLSRRVLADHPMGCVLVLSHLDVLTVQTYQRFKARMPGVKIGILQGNTFPNYMDDVVISTMQSASIAEKIKKFKDRCLKKVVLIIVDEAHYILTASYQKVFSYFPGVKVLGVTASPFRDGKLMTDYFDTISYSISTQELIDKGWIVPPKLFQMLSDSGDIEAVMATVAKVYLDKEKGKKAIVFMQTKEDAKAMRNVLVANGIGCSSVTDEVTGQTRAEIFHNFKYGKTDVLTTVNVLTAGFDCDRIEAIFMPFPTSSPTTYMQRIGRGLRICPEIGKTECRVYLRGDSPSIKSGFYQKLNDFSLQDGSQALDTRVTVHDDLRWMEISGESSGEKYEWTKTTVDVVDRLNKLDLTPIADILKVKHFPRRFLNDIGKFSQFLEAKHKREESRLSDAQSRFLKYHGFKDKDLQGIDQGTAKNLIAGIQNYLNRDPFVLKDGLYKGMHIKDTPPLYRKSLYQPNRIGSNATRLHIAWKEFLKKQESEKGGGS